MLDTGVDLDHEDLASKLVSGATFANCQDDDGDADVISMSFGALPGGQALTITGLVGTVRDAVDNVVAAPEGDAFLSCERDVISTIPMDAEEGFCEGTWGRRTTTSRGEDAGRRRDDDRRVRSASADRHVLARGLLEF